MSSARFLFVYGTLQSAFTRNPFARRLQREGILIGRAMIPGRLYGLKRYPALRPAQTPEDWVHGELYRLLRPEVTLAALDAYEAAEYLRVRRTVKVGDSRQVRCWVYLFLKPLPRHRRVATGRWKDVAQAVVPAVSETGKGRDDSRPGRPGGPATFKPRQVPDSAALCERLGSTRGSTT